MDDKELCPRLIDFLVVVGRKPDSKLQKAPPIGAHVSPADVPPLRRRHGFAGVANPEILRRYPTDNHRDFALPTDVTYFCQPEGCVTVGENYRRNRAHHETTSFIFMLTEKDTSKIRYGITLNFFLHFEPRPTHATAGGNSTKRSRKPTSSLTSLCLISHHPFLSTFAELLRLLAQLIDACNLKCNADDSLPRDSVWMVLTGHWTGPIPAHVMAEIKQLETWILMLLSSPVPVPGKTKLILQTLPEEIRPPMEFALPDHTRFTMVDFPLHLPLELLGPDTVIQLLTAVMLEHKVVLQSRNYNAVSMCVLSLVALMYPLEYMFPVIPLLPTFLQNAEQLLLAPTPFVIGLPASFFLCKGIRLPEDVVLVDLDTNELTVPDCLRIPPPPRPELDSLREDFARALGKSRVEADFDASHRMDPDEIDVATRIAMIRFFDSPNIFAHFSEHTRTLRLYPRPVVALQTESFLRSRPDLSQFVQELCKTQSVEYFAEECLCPRNEVFVRVQHGTTAARQVGDKLKWFADDLMPVNFNAYPPNSTLYETYTAWQKARLAFVSDDEEEPSDLESVGMDESLLTMSPFSEHAPDLEFCKPIGEVNDVYHAPHKLQLPASRSRLSLGSSVSSGRSSPASTNSECGNDSEADFARLAQNLAIKSNERGDFQFDAPAESDDSTPVQGARPVVLSGGAEAAAAQSARQPDAGERVFGAQVLHALNGYAERSHGVLGSLFSRTVPRAQALRERTLKPLQAAATRLEHGQHAIQQKAQHAHALHHGEPDSTQAAQLQMKNQQTIREVCDQVLNGQGVGVFQTAKLKRLLEDESLRELVCQKLNQAVARRYTEEDHLQRVALSRAQYKGYLRMLHCCLHGLRHSYQSPHAAGLASLFHVLEIGHTHFWAANEPHTPGSGLSSAISTPTSSAAHMSSPSSHKASVNQVAPRAAPGQASAAPASLQPGEPDQQELGAATTTAAAEQEARRRRAAAAPPPLPPRRPSGEGVAVAPSHAIPPTRHPPPPPLPNRPPPAAHAPAPSLPQRPPPPPLPRRENGATPRHASVEPPFPPPAAPARPHRAEPAEWDAAEGGALRNGTATTAEAAKSAEAAKPTSSLANGSVPTQPTQQTNHIPNGHGPNPEKPKTLFVAKTTSPSNSSTSTLEPTRHFLYQDLISGGQDLWANMTFWENAFFDMVAKERDIIGMDQEPSEMIDRYGTLNEAERKRLELDEDRILACLLHNLAAYMVMCGAAPRVLQQKVRRLLGKAHIGLVYSKKINQLLDELPPPATNLVPLKPLGSRLVRKHSFAVHAGDNADAPVSFMEVCDDAVIIRACSGQIAERWWYERLVNMTYSPRTRVLCIWRRQDDQVHMHKFYTKKCRSAYSCMKAAMERAAQRGKVTTASRDLGGEFPVHDIETSEGGLLQVRIDGVRLLFADRQDFIELANIKRCNTYGGNMFVLEEYDRQKNVLTQRRYISTMARHAAWALHRMFSARWALDAALAAAPQPAEGRRTPPRRPPRAAPAADAARRRSTPPGPPSRRARPRRASALSLERTGCPHELRLVARLESASDDSELEEQPEEGAEKVEVEQQQVDEPEELQVEADQQKMEEEVEQQKVEELEEQKVKEELPKVKEERVEEEPQEVKEVEEKVKAKVEEEEHQVKELPQKLKVEQPEVKVVEPKVAERGPSAEVAARQPLHLSHSMQAHLHLWGAGEEGGRGTPDPVDMDDLTPQTEIQPAYLELTDLSSPESAASSASPPFSEHDDISEL